MTSAHRSRLVRLVAVALVSAAGLVGLTVGPAGAAYCSTSGVNVVVDFGALGGGVQKACDPSGAGQSGDKVFPAAGFPLEYAQRQPGFVCRIMGSPSDDPCVNTPPPDAYWGLFWSDGRSGKWNYATAGVAGTSVPSGGFLGFAWQSSTKRRLPATSPMSTQAGPTRTPTPKPTRKPKPTKTSQPAGAPKPTRTASTQATAATTKATPSAAATRTRTPKPAASSAPTAPTASATTSESASASTTLDPTGSAGGSPDASTSGNLSSDFTPADEQSGLPPWIPVGVVLALALAAFGGLWWRSRSGTS
ncbi:MAG: hypothetical protein JWQ93_1166 [Marmoricola sp.]|nr:hypothetical protein [Marmoricola sp.]